MRNLMIVLTLWITPSAQAPPPSMIDAILKAWQTSDVVCLGEEHGRRSDSDLRVALVTDPRFFKLAPVIAVEFGNGFFQELLDSFIVDGANLNRDELAVIWRNANAPEVWESPLYETFFRAVREVNLQRPRDERIRVIAADSPIDWSKVQTASQLAEMIKRGDLDRGASLRTAVVREILEKGRKGLVVMGSGHCAKARGGFPSELNDAQRRRIWSIGRVIASQTQTVAELKRPPSYAVIKGSSLADVSNGGPDDAVLLRRPGLHLGDISDALVWFGAAGDEIVRPDLSTLQSLYGAEFTRRSRLMQEAQSLLKQ